jgi:hypothetical protein
VNPGRFKPRAQGGDHDPDNLITLCWYHHHVAIHQMSMIIDPDSPPHHRRLTWPNHTTQPQRGPPRRDPDQDNWWIAHRIPRINLQPKRPAGPHRLAATPSPDRLPLSDQTGSSPGQSTQALSWRVIPIFG